MPSFTPAQNSPKWRVLLKVSPKYIINSKYSVRKWLPQCHSVVLRGINNDNREVWMLYLSKGHRCHATKRWVASRDVLFANYYKFTPLWTRLFIRPKSSLKWQGVLKSPQYSPGTQSSSSELWSVSESDMVTLLADSKLWRHDSAKLRFVRGDNFLRTVLSNFMQLGHPFNAFPCAHVAWHSVCTRTRSAVHARSFVGSSCRAKFCPSKAKPLTSTACEKCWLQYGWHIKCNLPVFDRWWWHCGRYLCWAFVHGVSGAQCSSSHGLGRDKVRVQSQTVWTHAGTVRCGRETVRYPVPQ